MGCYRRRGRSLCVCQRGSCIEAVFHCSHSKRFACSGFQRAYRYTREITIACYRQTEGHACHPGVYQVAFTLAGFKTVRRGDVILEGNFTAQVSVELQVGAMEETLNVTAESRFARVESWCAESWARSASASTSDDTAARAMARI